jgi:hypothetical protein
MTNSMQKQIKLQQQQVIPIGTFIFIFVCGTVYFMAASKGSANIANWLSENCFVGFTTGKIIANMKEALIACLSGKFALMSIFSENLTKYLTIAFISTFASFDLIQVAGHCYFLWAFGASLEQRIGMGRYLMLAILGILTPWLVLNLELAGHNPGICYFGPAFLVCTFLGATFVFPPEKTINTEWFKSSRGKIFAPPNELDLTSKYQFKPNLFLFLFVAFEAFVWFYYRSYPTLKTISPLAAIISIVIGYAIVAILVFSATGSFKDGPIRLMTVKMYNDMLKLDVGHEVAIRGTSQAMGLPPERVREWVLAQKGKMTIS